MAKKGRLLFVGNNYNNNLNGNNNLNNNGRFLGITLWRAKTFLMTTNPRDLWQELCSYENLELAYKNARKRKTSKEYVIEFEKNLEDNLLLLRSELLLRSYRPKPLETFIIRDPKTRKISKSDFRDRIVHHALCNIIEPIFEKTFIHDSFANRKGKGTLKALQRFDFFKRKASRNNTRKCFVLKADIKHYFDTVSHAILLNLINRKIKDKNIIWLIKQILSNYCSDEKGKGMPLGNLTSQFFANVYLNELDYFFKNSLKSKYYIRYVDDFVIMHNDKEQLEKYFLAINGFLTENLDIRLHPDKSKIIQLKQGINFLGFRVFYYHKLLRKANIKKMQRRLQIYINKEVDYDWVYESFQGWNAYAMYADAYHLRKKFGELIQNRFYGSISLTEISQLMKHAVCV